MIFFTIMHQFNVIIHVKRVCGYVVDFSGYAARFGRDIQMFLSL